MILRIKLRCFKINIFKIFKVVKSLFFKKLKWLEFDLMKKFIKEQSYEESIWYHVCFNNVSNNEIIKMNWTRLQKNVEFENYIIF